MAGNNINVGGNVGGSVVAGEHNVVGAVVGAPHTPAAEQPRAAGAGKTPRLGFVLDVVGYGQRDADGREDLQQRLDELVGRVLADLGVKPADTVTIPEGDSKIVFLPVGADTSTVLPLLLSATAERLRRDNRRYTDRMRLRMAVGTGLLGDAPLGHSGDLIVDLNRLVNSAVIRQAVLENGESDLVLLVTHTLHDEVIRPGYLNRDEFVRVDVTMREFTAPGWLWLG